MEYQAMPPLEVQDSEGQDIQDTDVQHSSSMQQGDNLDLTHSHTPCYSSMAGVEPSSNTNSYLSPDSLGFMSMTSSNFAEQLVLGAQSSQISDGYSLSLDQSSGFFEFPQNFAGEQAIVEESPLDCPSAPFGVGDDIYHISSFHSVLPPTENPFHSESHFLPTDGLIEISPSYFEPLRSSDARLGLNPSPIFDVSSHDASAFNHDDAAFLFSFNTAQNSGTFENPVDLTGTQEIAYSTTGVQTAGVNPGLVLSNNIVFTNVKKQQLAPNAFGPSRPVVLPPRRLGGRKGKLSTSDLKNLREAKKKGVCIKCRHNNGKCDGGQPCKSCARNRNAVFWKFPCTKAEFLGLLEYGSCFEEMETYQTFVLEFAPPKRTISQIEAMVTMISTGHPTSHITAMITAKHTLDSVTVDWIRGLEIVQKLVEQCGKESSFQIGRQLIRTPYRLANSNITGLPLHIGQLLENDLKDMGAMEAYCSMKLVVTEDAWKTEASANTSEDVQLRFKDILQDTIELLAWISRRYYEIKMFQNLQRLANRLDTLSAEQLFEAALMFKDQLFYRSVNLWKIDEIFNCNVERSNKSKSSYYDRQTRIDQAMFIYFSIILERYLPKGYDFWSHQSARDRIGFMDQFRTANVQDFTRICWHEIARADCHIALLFEAIIDEIPTEELQEAINEILCGPRNMQADLEAVAIRLSNHYRPVLESLHKIVDFIKLQRNGTHEFHSIITKLEGVFEIGEHIYRNVESALGEREGFIGTGNLDSVIKKAFEFMIFVDELYSMVMAVGRLKDVRRRYPQS